MRTIIITCICLIAAFALWVELSPDVPSGSAATTAIPATAGTTEESAGTSGETTAATAAPTQAQTTVLTQAQTTATVKMITTVNTDAEALELVSQLTEKNNLEFLREENFIENEDGTLSIDVNTPENAHATCFIISPKNGSGDGYENCYMVLKGTSQVYKPKAGGEGILVRMN